AFHACQQPATSTLPLSLEDLFYYSTGRPTQDQTTHNMGRRSQKQPPGGANDTRDIGIMFQRPGPSKMATQAE
ncbi:Hypothetical predicted protein, partial [Pelobates cultripes]